ncbi:hypothetical protein BC936DRAFT_142844 [Jimgerdemannia flammicorona]|uniref:Uncharacterized protein n=1 Tax=Jimgerdemannia flammicorona TaxID=994334 RepID=A0A433A082_9FUNG|nr:hypothetical protein BC936DRAFT_142844 [Jimgerdemannia flammicorona]
MRRISRHEVTASAALLELEAVMRRPPYYSRLLYIVMGGGICACCADGTWTDSAVSALWGHWADEFARGRLTTFNNVFQVAFTSQYQLGHDAATDLHHGCLLPRLWGVDGASILVGHRARSSAGHVDVRARDRRAMVRATVPGAGPGDQYAVRRAAQTASHLRVGQWGELRGRVHGRQVSKRNAVADVAFTIGLVCNIYGKFTGQLGFVPILGAVLILVLGSVGVQMLSENQLYQGSDSR